MKNRSNELEHETEMLRNRLKTFYMISVEELNQCEIVRGSSCKTDSVKLEKALMKKLKDPNLPKNSLNSTLEKILLNTDMDTDLQFEEVCQTLCTIIIDFGEMLPHKMLKSVGKLLSESNVKQINHLFSLVSSYDLSEIGQEDSQIFKNCNIDKESIKRQMEKDIDHLASKAKKYDPFLYPADLRKTVQFAIRIL